MTPELTVLALAALLQAIQFTLYSVAANLQVGPKKAMSPRDQKIDLTGGAGRLQRAMNNHFEGLILFTIAVVVITLGDKGTGLSAICAWTYLGARILYVPAYYFGLAPWRSLIWFVGFLSTILMIVSALI
ncbi:MAG: MAPEG family protein [Pseudomonadota bacterium]